MKRHTKLALLALAAPALIAATLLTWAVVVPYAKLRRKPRPFSAEVREKRRLSVELDCATESVRTHREERAA